MARPKRINETREMVAGYFALDAVQRMDVAGALVAGTDDDLFESMLVWADKLRDIGDEDRSKYIAAFASGRLDVWSGGYRYYEQGNTFEILSTGKPEISSGSSGRFPFVELRVTMTPEEWGALHPYASGRKSHAFVIEDQTMGGPVYRKIRVLRGRFDLGFRA